MASKQLVFSEEARQALQRGVDAVSNAVKVTLGPKGRNVVIQNPYGLPTITKDGVTVAKAVELSDPYEDLGAQLCKQVSARTNDVAGDGTTTATVLAQAIVKEGLRYVAAGGNPLGLKRGIDKAVDCALEMIEETAKAIETKEEINYVATISGNDKEVGNVVADAMEAVGTDGVITIEEGRGRDTELEFTEGLRFDKGYFSPYFVNHPERMEVRLSDVAVLLVDGVVKEADALFGIFQQIANAKKAALLICRGLDGDARDFMVQNVYVGKKPWAAVQAPGFGNQQKDFLNDLAAFTGATLFTSEVGMPLGEATMDHLGYAKSIRVSRESTTLIEGGGDEEEVEARIVQIRALLEGVESDYERKVLQDRLSKLSDGVAVIRVGASTAAEMEEKKYRFEDALNATRAAIEEGIVPGGGVTLLRISKKLKNVAVADHDEKIGVEIAKRALEEPIRQIAANAGYSPDVVVNDVLRSKEGRGLDAQTGKMVNMMEKGIIDPAKVTKSALQNAASIAGLLLTTETLIVDKPVEGQQVLVSEGML